MRENAPPSPESHEEVPSFQEILKSEVGERFNIVDDINVRIHQAESDPMTREVLLKTIQVVDEVMAQYAHDNRYTLPTEIYNKVVDELAQWARLRSMITQDILPNLKEGLSQPARERVKSGL